MLQSCIEQGFKCLQGQQSASQGTGLPFVVLNGAFARDVACVSVPAGVKVQQPLHILYLSTGALESVPACICFAFMGPADCSCLGKLFACHGDCAQHIGRAVMWVLGSIACDLLYSDLVNLVEVANVQTSNHPSDSAG